MLVLKDGRVLELTTEQSQKLSLAIMLAPSLDKRVKLSGQEFSLNEIVTDKEQIKRLLQQDIFKKGD